MSYGYVLDKHLDEFEDFVRISKDSNILDVAAGTGLIGQRVIFKWYTFTLTLFMFILMKINAMILYLDDMICIAISAETKRIQ